MKSKLILLTLAAFPLIATAAPAEKTLRCEISYRFKDAAGAVQEEKQKAEAKFKDTGMSFRMAEADTSVGNGRFEVRSVGVQDASKRQNVRSGIIVYDTVTRTGSQACGLNAKLPPAPKCELNYSYDMSGPRDYDLDRVLTVSCDIK